uniref:ATP synthase complex subunit 8 n=1 Tax=Cherax cainii TaxID=223846 RepID=V5LZP7_9EUCA|nr:ATP synthase F0 subunit 8 [Cherax cainii]AHA59369.1 ATP synthase F0 subunit 8 [Cherax cainii]CDN96581.1 ATP synthase F0 subunit 8 [Cherax cainii]
MPQMSPLLWFNLFLMFILGYLLFSILNYFSRPPIKTETAPLKPIFSNKSWKW